VQFLRFLALTPLLLSAALALDAAQGGEAWAHRLSVFAYVEGDAVRVESKFGSGRACQECDAQVVDSGSGAALASGKTDAEGRFGYAPASKPTADVKIVIAAPGGHQGEWTLSVAELAQLGARSEGAASVSKTVPAAASQAPAHSRLMEVDEQRLRALVAEELEKKIAPLRAMLVNGKLGGPSVSEIAGGIGYIIGLAGLAVLLKGRRR